jgi:hypothetical protein
MPETLDTPATQTEQLTPEQQAVQRQQDAWAEAHPGKSYRNSEWLNLGPEDIAYIEAEADRYSFDIVDRKSIVESYTKLEELKVQREAELRQKYEAEGYSGAAFEKLIAEKTAQTVNDTRLELIEQALPVIVNANRRDRKRIEKQRQNLFSILDKSREDFDTLQSVWSLYEDVQHTEELDRLHGEALKDDKKLKATTERSRIKQEMAELDDNNGGVLEYMAGLPIDGDERTAEVLRTYQEKVERHGQDDDLLDADNLQAFNDFRWRLGELFADQAAAAGKPLTDEQIRAKCEEADPYIEDWLDAIADNGGDPMGELSRYKTKETAFQNWDERRRQAAEYLAPVIMMRSVRNLMRRSPEASAPEFHVSKTVKAVLDPNKIGERNGARALRDQDKLTDDDARVYRAGVRGQLETAIRYSRHQGNVMKAALVFNAITIGAYNSLSDHWDRLSESEKQKELRKKMLGKAVVSKALAKKIAAKAAKKSKAAWFAPKEAAEEKS